MEYKLVIGDGITKSSELIPIEVISESEVKIIRIGGRDYSAIFSRVLDRNIILEHIHNNDDVGMHREWRCH